MDTATAVVLVLLTAGSTMLATALTYLAVRPKGLSKTSRVKRGGIGLAITFLLAMVTLWVHMKIDSNYPLWWSLEDNMPDPAGWAAVVDLFCATYFGMVIVVILTKLKLF